MSLQTPYRIKTVAYGSPAYEKTVALRDEILRKPLGMKFTAEQLAAEIHQVHIAAFDENENVVGCCVLRLNNDKTKMRQVAVAANLQRTGIGKALCLYCEAFAKSQNHRLIYCHARTHAAAFYEKLGYKIAGEPFTEVGIKHYRMEKRL